MTIENPANRRILQAVDTFSNIKQNMLLNQIAFSSTTDIESNVVFGTPITRLGNDFHVLAIQSDIDATTGTVTHPVQKFGATTFYGDAAYDPDNLPAMSNPEDIPYKSWVESQLLGGSDMEVVATEAELVAALIGPKKFVICTQPITLQHSDGATTLQFTGTKLITGNAITFETKALSASDNSVEIIIDALANDDLLIFQNDVIIDSGASNELVGCYFSDDATHTCEVHFANIRHDGSSSLYFEVYCEDGTGYASDQVFINNIHRAFIAEYNYNDTRFRTSYLIPGGVDNNLIKFRKYHEPLATLSADGGIIHNMVQNAVYSEGTGSYPANDYLYNTFPFKIDGAPLVYKGNCTIEYANNNTIYSWEAAYTKSPYLWYFDLELCASKCTVTLKDFDDYQGTNRFLFIKTLSGNGVNSKIIADNTTIVYENIGNGISMETLNGGKFICSRDPDDLTGGQRADFAWQGSETNPTDFRVGWWGNHKYIDTLDFTFNDSTRVYTVFQSGFEAGVNRGFVRFYSNNKEWCIANGDSRLTVTLPNTSGTHFVYFDDYGQLQYVGSPTFTYDMAAKYHTLAGIVYDPIAVIKVAGELSKRHAAYTNDIATTLRYSSGAKISYDGNGVKLTGLSLNGTTIGNDSGGMIHLGYRTDIPAVLGSSQTWRKLYFDGLNSYSLPYVKRSPDLTNKICITDTDIGVGSTGYIIYNYYNGTFFVPTAISVSSFACIHVFSTLDSSNPLIIIPGFNAYSNISSARAGASGELLTYLTTGAPTFDTASIGTLILNALGQIQDVDGTGKYWIDFRYQTAIGTARA